MPFPLARPPKGSRIDFAPFPSINREFDFFARVFQQHASPVARWALQFGQVCVLSLRRESSTIGSHGKGSYDDVAVVLHRLGRVRRVNRFPICTEPGAQYSERAAPSGQGRVDGRYAGVTFSKKEGADVNHDGIGDAGRLRAGTYRYFEKQGGYLGDRAFNVKQIQTTERDTDGDGRFTANDAKRVDLKTAGTSMYIHRGGADSVLEPNTWSAGCQTIPKNKYKHFLAAIGHAPFYYVLVDWC